MTTILDDVLKQVKLPFVGNLRDYQVTDILAAFEEECYGLYLDLGLGKTVMSTLIGACKIVSCKAEKIYVLCPASLITQWYKVVKIMGLSVLAYQGKPAERKALRFKDYDLIIMSYEIYRIDYEKIIAEFPAKQVYYIVDECTLLCETTNKLYKMLRGGEETKKKGQQKATVVDGKIVMAKTRPPIVYERQMHQAALLTATPINKPTDSYGLISITSPGAYSSQYMFERLHVKAKNTFGVAVEYDNLDLLSEHLLSSAILRRTADHVELPPIIYNTICYELSPKHKALYNRLLDEKFLELPDGEVINALNASALRHWSQKIILNPESGGLDEVPMALQLLDTLLEGQDKFLIFANYIASNAAIMKRYNIGGLFGKVSKAKKEKFKIDFKEGSLNGLAVHLKSGGYGLDLPEAGFINHLEIPITPRDFRQGNGRAHRPGQKRAVGVNLLYAKGTIQESLMKRLFEVDAVSGEILSDPKSLEGDLMTNPNATQPITKEDLIKEMKGIN